MMVATIGINHRNQRGCVFRRRSTVRSSTARSKGSLRATVMIGQMQRTNPVSDRNASNECDREPSAHSDFGTLFQARQLRVHVVRVHRLGHTSPPVCHQAGAGLPTDLGRLTAAVPASASGPGPCRRSAAGSAQRGMSVQQSR